MTESKKKVDAAHDGASVDLRSEAKLALKYEIQRRGLTYKQVAEMLQKRGWNESYTSINQRISRGAFKMTFFMAVMSCIGAKEVNIRIPDIGTFEYDENEVAETD